MYEEDDFFMEDEMDNYKRLDKRGQGTYGEVYMALDKKRNKIVALKKILTDLDQEGIPSTAMREISLVREITHPNVVQLLNVIIDQKYLYMVFELLDMDLKQYLDSLAPQEFLDEKTVKIIIYQILSGTSACHSNRILHRDLKSLNILINKDTKQIKLADFGLARTFSIPIRPYTHEVVTLWYRAPELLLGASEYCTPVDIWSIGTIFVELVTKRPLFTGDSEIDQIFRIFRLFGTPNEQIWPGFTSLKNFKVTFPKYKQNRIQDVVNNLNINAQGLDLLNKMLTYDPSKRISAKKALQHPYFDDIREQMRY